MVWTRIAWSGAGIVLQTGTPTPEHIRNAVRDVLNSTYRDRARILQESFARYDTPNTVTNLVEATIAERAEVMAESAIRGKLHGSSEIMAVQCRSTTMSVGAK